VTGGGITGLAWGTSLLTERGIRGDLAQGRRSDALAAGSGRPGTS
jgi:hypothetical protein